MKERTRRLLFAGLPPAGTDGGTPFAPGDRVRLGTGGSPYDGPFAGHTGTLVRPARLLWKKAWLVQLDEPVGRIDRTRVATWVLTRID